MNTYRLMMDRMPTYYIKADMVEFPANGSVIFSMLDADGEDHFLTSFSNYLWVNKVDDSPLEIESKKS